ncbi:hypothetical protein, partial [Microbacterium sp.]|uniref:hypothetical protein n=1 Tax=Microbacterium sp. TaxID=51671 RepID=UPI0039E69E8E
DAASADDVATRRRTSPGRGPVTPPSAGSSALIDPPGPSPRRARDPRLEPDDGHYGIRRAPLTEPVTRRPAALDAPRSRPEPSARTTHRRRGHAATLVVTVVLALLALTAAAMMLAVLVAS